jgi:thiol-disulfide isomerase/thioredoxin
LPAVTSSLPVDFPYKEYILTTVLFGQSVSLVKKSPGVKQMKLIAGTFLGKVSQIIALSLLLAINSAAAAKMPSFVLSNAMDGAPVSSADYDGKTLLITFFATWCPPCIQEIPTLMKLQQQFSNDVFSVVGLSVDEGGADVVAKLVKKRSINYPVLMADDVTARNFGGVVGIPTTFLINKEGNVVKKYPGYVPHSILERDIKQIMN